jgi:CheY-like chemotaxis protein
MEERLCRVLILDTDSDALITLQRLLEHADIDTTITWDENEARQLLETELFDLIVIGDHPPELDAAAVLQDLRVQSASSPRLVLRGIVREDDIEFFCGLGAIGVVSRRDPLMVLDQVTRALAPLLFKVTSRKDATAVTCSWRAVS